MAKFLWKCFENVSLNFRVVSSHYIWTSSVVGKHSLAPSTLLVYYYDIPVYGNKSKKSLVVTSIQLTGNFPALGCSIDKVDFR